MDKDKRGQNDESNILEQALIIDTSQHHLNLTESSRFKLSIFAAVTLTITGVCAYIYDPYHVDKFAFYTINMVLPIISYIIGRTIRDGRHSKGIISHPGTRYRTALFSYLITLTIGIICYIFSPENIDKLGMYMIGVALPIVGIILGQSFRKTTGEDNNTTQYNMGNYDSGGYDGFGGYSNFAGNHGDMTGYGYDKYVKPELYINDTENDDINDKRIDDYNKDGLH